MLLVQHGVGPAIEFNTRFGHVMQRWAKRHGLGYIFSTRQLMPHRSPHWEKPLLLLDLMEEQPEDLLWMDGDLTVVKEEESPIPAFKDWADLAMCHDQAVTPYNTGVMFLRNNSKMKGFLRDVIDKGPVPNVRHHDQARICERLPYHEIFLQTLELRWNFAGCTNWAKTGCEDPVIRAFHGWPKANALAALAELVTPPTVKKTHTLFDLLHYSLKKKLKLSIESATLQVLSNVRENFDTKRFEFSVCHHNFEWTHSQSVGFLWVRNSYGLALIMPFPADSFAKEQPNES